MSPKPTVDKIVDPIPTQNVLLELRVVWYIRITEPIFMYTVIMLQSDYPIEYEADAMKEDEYLVEKFHKRYNGLS